jgi:HlyD family secretion protein
MRTFLAIGVGILMVGSFFVYGRTSTSPTAPVFDKKAASPTPTTTVPVEVVDNTPAGEVVLESKGYVVPVHQVQVSPKVPGMVLELNFQEGQKVKKGDVLAQIETIDYTADRDRIKFSLEAARYKLAEMKTGFRPQEIAQAEAELAEARTQRNQFRTEWQRNASLNKKSVSDREYEQSLTNLKAAEERVKRAESQLGLMKEGTRIERVLAGEAEVKQLEAELTKSQWRLDNCTIRAPIDGTILAKRAEEGNIVNPVAFNVSASLCDMADLTDLEIDLNVQEREISKIHVGQKCRIRPEAYPGKKYDGVVSRLMPIADRAKGAVPVRVKILLPAGNDAQQLKPEMSATVSFLKSE